MESVIFKTLLHSLWQGVLLALLSAVIILLTTKSNARLRYNLFAGSLLLFVAGVTATFFIEWSAYLDAASSAPTIVTEQVQILHTTAQENFKFSPSPLYIDSIISYLSRYSALIVMVWALIICAKSIRFMVDIRTLFLVKSTNVHAAGSMLEEKVKALSAQYGIKQKVQILQSGMVQVPMALGHFKPLILVPLGLVNGLSAAEVEAILAHELAHIKRKDFLVNLLQSVVEILFFFNPAVLWVSKMIRTERENCCDDLAISTSKTRVDYIRALVTCQEFANSVPAYAMAVNGGKGNLVNRVQRLISARNKSLNNIEKALVGIALVTSVVLTSAFSGRTAVAQVVEVAKKANLYTDKTELQQDTSKKKMVLSNVIIHKNENVQLKNVKISNNDLSLSGAGTDSLTTALAGEVNEHLERQTQSNRIYKQLVKDGLINPNEDISFSLDNDALIVNGVKQSNSIFKSYKAAFIKSGNQSIKYVKKGSSVTDQRNDDSDSEVIAAKAEVVAAKAAAQAQAVAIRAEKAAMQAQMQANRARAAATRAMASAQAQLSSPAVPATPSTPQAPNTPSLMLTDVQIAKSTPAAKGEMKVVIQGGLSDDLIAEGLIKNKNRYKYKLNDSKLVIDGEEQPAAIHNKYKKKYLKHANQEITTAVTVD